MGTNLAFLWHMHQPLYRDAVTGKYALPFVGLHATRSYYDMVKVLSEFPDVKATFNFTPVLLAQLDDYATRRAADPFLDISMKPADGLTLSEREFALKNFFNTNWEHVIGRSARYRQLLERRGRTVDAERLKKVAKALTHGEVRDLQTHFILGWMGFAVREEDPCVAEIARKDRQYTEADKAALFESARTVTAKVATEYRKALERGQIEVSTSPFYHPILPLLVDTESAKRAMPAAAMPIRFSWPQDAREQVRRAVEHSEKVFGRKPAGMWPSEGSVSPEALEAFGESGVRWVASDEEVLFKSLDNWQREAVLYRPCLFETARGGVSIFFRDRALSDLIGFSYSHSPARQAAEDFCARVAKACRDWRGRGEPLVTVVLDGENPWDSYRKFGGPFLRALYGKLSGSEEVRTVTFSEYLDRHGPGARIERLHSGSWISADFHVWIGSAEKNRAWDLLGRTRRAVEKAEADPAPVDAGKVAKAKERLMAAEGSDWFWWYGDDYTSPYDAEFDTLFRRNLLQAFHDLDQDPPEELGQPIIAKARDALPYTAPKAILTPQLDGRITSYFEWLGAGHYAVSGQKASAMSFGARFIRSLHYGFDAVNLYVRIDMMPEADFDERTRIAVRLHRQDNAVEFSVPAGKEVDRGMLSVRVRQPSGAWVNGAETGAWVQREIVEMAIPLNALGIKKGDRVKFSVHVQKDGIDIERHPIESHIYIRIEGEEMERMEWKV